MYGIVYSWRGLCCMLKSSPCYKKKTVTIQWPNKWSVFNVGITYNKERNSSNVELYPNSVQLLLNSQRKVHPYFLTSNSVSCGSFIHLLKLLVLKGIGHAMLEKTLPFRVFVPFAFWEKVLKGSSSFCQWNLILYTDLYHKAPEETKLWLWIYSDIGLVMLRYTGINPVLDWLGHKTVSWNLKKKVMNRGVTVVVVMFCASNIGDIVTYSGNSRFS